MKKKKRLEREWLLFCHTNSSLSLLYLDDPFYENMDKKELKVDTSHFMVEFLCPIGTCNGLLCLGDKDRDRNPVYILDPINARFLTIRNSPDPLDSEADKLGFMSGFGYDEVSGVYKVLRLFGGDWCPLEDITICTICTVHPEHGAMGWRSLDPIMNCLVVHEQSGIFFSGKLYFLLIEQDLFVEVFCFDVAKEKFSRIPGPAQLKRVDVNLMHIGLFEGKLVLVFCNSHEGLIRIWSINDDSSWTVLFDVPFDLTYAGEFCDIEPLKHMSDGRLLMFNYYRGEILSYNYRVKEPKYDLFLRHLDYYNVFSFTPNIKFNVTARGEGMVGCYHDAWSSDFFPFDDSVFTE
ncbi:hypothetical protein QJS04_geneDACA016384 [Acorus gramineus]|uniref:F-box associated beta-propeller type 3 domain-containing protein n=1 Tax=Acorus gramineus TaxID=55184 RepID=A0AAV9ASA6_ACOGR|nr:hypothetical protein QJS04_geneDACA016384 [Acorus gramineus]